MADTRGDAVLFYDPNDPPLGNLVVALEAFKNKDARIKVTKKPGSDGSLTFMRSKETIPAFVADRYCARVLDSVAGSALYGTDVASAAQIDVFLAAARDEFAKSEGLDAVISQLNTHLESRTYVVGSDVTVADAALWGALKRNEAFAKLVKDKANTFPNVNRWLATLDAHQLFAAAVKILEQSPLAKLWAAPTADVEEKKKSISKEQGGSYDIDLPGAALGKVCTRFPPEPSGYLHVGHAKAALLNNYFARLYQGRLILRFDDTNPSKEKDEYVENILRDLDTLQIKFDVTTHTSDHFDKIQQYAEQMLKDGKAYIDDTDVETMRKNRESGVESPARNNSVEENLRRWQEMIKGTEFGLKCCMRAKIDMKAKNGTLRDPVLYRCNLTPHHRTGTKYKLYPTYDFACPIVDSIEGVTHALRTVEYHDRNEQYEWIQKAMNLRTVHIWDFGRLSFKFSLMSKRKLQYFVDNKLVDGWYDPRFPTVQGIVRRGLTIEALHEFIRIQGASKINTAMEWDKIWNLNKKVIDPTAHRYVAVSSDSPARLVIVNAPAALKKGYSNRQPLHPKDASIGEKMVPYKDIVLLEQEDAKQIAENEEITLMNWGNCICKTISRNANGVITEIKGELNLNGDPKNTSKKLNWVADAEDKVDIQLVEFDYLLTKPVLDKDERGEEEDFRPFIRNPSRIESALVGEPALRNVKQGQIIQLMRRCFARCDEAISANHPRLTLFLIPDGKEKAMSSLSTNVQKTIR